MAAIAPIGLTKEILGTAMQKLNGSSSTGSDFGQHLKNALSQVASAQGAAGQLSEAFESGAEVDVAKVMMAREKSALAFEATLQIRNKVLSAYKDIVSMPV